MINPDSFIDPYLTTPDLLVLENLLRDIDRSGEEQCKARSVTQPNGERCLYSYPKYEYTN